MPPDMSAREFIYLEFINEQTLKAAPGQTLLEISLKAGIPHHHACGGKAQCTTCRVLVEDGADYLTDPTEAEIAISAKRHLPSNVRLACQARLRNGPVRVHRLIKDQTDLQLMPGGSRGKRSLSLGEQRDLALFFLDIRDFTAFSEKHLPFDVMHILNRFHRMVGKIITANRGQTIEVAGDGLYAVFGLKSSVSRGVWDAVSAATEILGEIDEFNSSYTLPFFNHRIEVGIGLHAGRVICGQVGIGVGDALSVMGYEVSVAARHEQATKVVGNSFLVSEAAFLLLGQTEAELKAESREISLKGVPAPCRVYLMGDSYAS